jgi:hypothetical protein
MTVLSQLLPARTLLSLNQSQLDSIYGLFEAEALRNEAFMKTLRAKLEREVVVGGATKAPARGKGG